MEKKDMSISHDDLADIFSADEDIKPLPDMEKAAKDEKKEPEIKSKLILDRAQEAYIVQEKAAPEAAIPPAPETVRKQETKEPDAGIEFSSFMNEKVISEIIREFNEIRGLLSKQLAGKIEPRAIDNMQLKTLEKSALNFPLLKSAGWDEGGNLVPDGTINSKRFINNMTLYRESIKEIDKEVEESLKAVLVMRLKAVKTGLGADKYAAIKENLRAGVLTIEAGYRKNTAEYVRKSILENSIRKADE